MAFTEELKNPALGGIPVWGIGLGLAGVVLLVVAIKRRNTPPPVSPDTPDNAFVSDQSAIGPLNPIDQYLQNDPTNPAYPVGLTAQGLPGPITNAQWARLAFDWLVGKGDDPTLVENALAKYLSGQPLSAQEDAIKNLAQQTFGAPPEGLIQVTVTQNPPDTQPPPSQPPPSQPPPSQPSGGSAPPPSNPYINPDGTVSVGAGADLYLVADSVGLSGPPGHARFAALNPVIWTTNSTWRTVDGGLHPFAKRGMPYKYR